MYHMFVLYTRIKSPLGELRANQFTFLFGRISESRLHASIEGGVSQLKPTGRFWIDSPLLCKNDNVTRNVHWLLLNYHPHTWGWYTSISIKDNIRTCLCYQYINSNDVRCDHAYFGIDIAVNQKFVGLSWLIKIAILFTAFKCFTI